MTPNEHPLAFRFYPRRIAVASAGAVQGPGSAFRRRRPAVDNGASLGSKIARTEMRR